MTTAIFLSNSLQGARDSDAIGLDAVENFSVSQPSQVTNHPVEDGSNSSDHYYQDPKTATFSGVISPWNFTGKGSELSPVDFVRIVERTIVGKQPFDLFLSDDLESIPNCLITKFDYNREAKEGKSILVDVTVQQVRITPRAQEADITDLALANDVSEQGQGTADEGDAAPKTSLLERTEAGIRVGQTAIGGLQ